MIKRFFILTALVVALASLGYAQDVVGDWQGPLTTQMGELRLIVHVTKADDGTLKGVMDSPDQAMAGAPLDSFTVSGSKVHFTLNVAQGVFDGTLKGNGTITGYWTQGANGQKMQLVLNKTTSPLKMEHAAAPPSDIDGTWEGMYEIPTGNVPQKMHVTFHIKNTADGLTATADVPDGSIKGWPATAVSRKGSSVHVTLKQISVIFEGKLNKGLDTITGDWIQGDSPARAMNMKKTQGPEPSATKADAPKQ